MGIGELLLIAVGLSMDAFAVAVCKGLGMRRVDWRAAAVLALFFGGFQALMPLAGWAVGSRLMWLIEPVDHWVAFILLAIIGAKMLVESLRTGRDPRVDADAREAGRSSARIDLAEFFMLAVATSIDALAVGVSFAALDVAIVPSVALIGVTTFVLTLVGVVAGNRFGARYERPAGIVGGTVLVLIGLKILLEGLGIIG